MDDATLPGVQRMIVLGVGTHIGKTWVASALARSAPPGTCLALKPIESGCALGAPAADAATLAIAAGHPLVTPRYALAEPVTPWLSAELEGISIELPLVRAWVTSHCQAYTTTIRDTTCIIETAGGVFSPLTRSETNLDLARALEPAVWLLVVPNRLGVLHDVGATIAAMRSLFRAPDLIVLNQQGPADASTATNLSLLRQLHSRLPFLAASGIDPPSLESVRHALARA